MRELTYTIVLEPAEEGGYNVSVLALPGCFTQGNSYDHAVQMAKDAIALWLETMTAEGLPIPDENSMPEVQIARVQVTAPADT